MHLTFQNPGITPAARHPALRFLTALLLSSSTVAEAAVYRCDSATGDVVYSQFGCPAGTEGELSVTTSPGIISIPALSQHELDRLLGIDDKLRIASLRNAKHRARSRQQQSKAAAHARSECDKAETALVDLKSIRRTGYRVSEARSLDRREQKWRAMKKANC